MLGPDIHRFQAIGRHRCEHRKSSYSIVGMRTIDQTCRSPRHHTERGIDWDIWCIRRNIMYPNSHTATTFVSVAFGRQQFALSSCAGAGEHVASTVRGGIGGLQVEVTLPLWLALPDRRLAAHRLPLEVAARILTGPEGEIQSGPPATHRAGGKSCSCARADLTPVHVAIVRLKRR
jgi:hypothetical protein